MQILRRYFRQATWFALVAILGLALAPTVSHALTAAGHGSPWTEICSASNPSGVVPADSTPAAAEHMAHCPLCGVAAAPGLPPGEPPAPRTPEGADHVAALFLSARATLHAWVSAQPRAPPASC